jgi:acyl-CoA synthetase (NDP forming)
MAMSRDVRFPPFDDCTKPRVAATLNEYVAIDNPLDYHTFIWNDEAKLTATFSAVLAGGFDTAMLILDIPTNPRMKPDTWLVTAKALMNAADATKARAAMVASLPECMPLGLADELARHGVGPMVGLDDALAAFEAAAMIGRNWERRDVPPHMIAPTPAEGAARTLSEAEAKKLLAGFGLAIPEGRVCNAEDAATNADDLGYPVTLKVSSDAIAHKTEAGGVALNLGCRADVEREAERMSRLAPQLLVERMITGAVAELIIGIKTDPQFGLALVIGAGGILAELLRDAVTLILPTSRPEIERGLKKLRAWTLVEGFRGRKGNARAVIAAIEAVAAFAEAHRGTLEELDVNPLLVLPEGAVAVDALIKMRKT